MDVAHVVAPSVLAVLADRFQEREDLDVAHGAADLGDDHIDVFGCHGVDATLDFVGDVRDDLHGLAEVVATPLGGQNGLVDGTSGGVGTSRQILVDESFVVPEIEVGFASIVGDEHLTVLVRVHRAGVDVDVRVQFLEGDPQTPHFQQTTQGTGRQTLAQGAGNTTCHENVFRHLVNPPSGAVEMASRIGAVPQRHDGS